MTVAVCFKQLKLILAQGNFSGLWENICTMRKMWSRVLGSRSGCCGFDLRPILDGSGVKAMPG